MSLEIFVKALVYETKLDEMHSNDLPGNSERALEYHVISSKNQYLMGVCANILNMALGASCGWPSFSFLILESETTPLESGPLTTEELSWIVSIFCFSGLIGNFLFGWLANKCGRKKLLYILAMPQLLSWLLIMFAKNAKHLYISRVLVGLSGGGGLVIVPIIIAEVSEDRVRGRLGSILCLFQNAGILLAFVVGYFFEYETVPQILMTLPISLFVTMMFFPETPCYLLSIGKVEEAEKSLRFYRSITNKEHATEYVREELSRLKLRFQSNQKIVGNTSITFNDFTRKASRKAFLIAIIVVLITECSGSFILVSYTATIFSISGSILSPNLSAIIIGLLQLLGTYVSTIYVDKVGRKFLLIVSTVGTGVGNFCLGIYMYATIVLRYDLSSWIPIISFSVIVFLASIGMIPLTFVILTDFLPEKIRGIGSAICLSVSWLFGFVILKYFTAMSMLIGMYSCIWFFAISCFLGTLFVIYVIPETKGRSFYEIQKKLES